MKIYIVRMKIESAVKVSSHHLRAFMLKKFAETPLGRATAGSEGRMLTYPIIQYKILDDQPFIMGLNEGADALKEVSGELNELYLGHKLYKVIDRQEEETEHDLGPVKKHKNYKFVTPWLAINDMDYQTFKYQYEAERAAVLSKMVVRNILGMAKAFNCFVDIRIKVRHQMTEIPPFKLGTNVPGFVGDFSVNFVMPELIGMGNMADRGFGTITSK